MHTKTQYFNVSNDVIRRNEHFVSRDKKNEVKKVIFIKAQIMPAKRKDYCITVWLFSNEC